MSYTLIDYFRGFHDLKQRHNLSASAQAVYFSILGEFNVARFPEQLSISDRELKRLSGVKSVATAHDAKRILKNVGLIEFAARQGGITCYTLSANHLSKNQTNRTVTEQLPNSCRTVGGSSYIHVREDVKTLRLKEEEARGSYGSDGLTAEETAALDALVDEWQDSPVFCKLDVKLISQLAALLKEHGAAAMRTAMEAARRTQKSGVNLAYFTRALKGGDKRDQSIVYEPVDTGWIYSPQAADA